MVLGSEVFPRDIFPVDLEPETISILETKIYSEEELLARRIRQAMNPVEGNPSAVCKNCQSRFDTDDYIYQSGNLVIVFNHEGSFQKARLEWQPHHGV